MKIIGLLSFYEESPAWLGAIVAGLRGFVDHLVVADGAYFLFPDSQERPVSGFEQTEAIMLACQTACIGCTVHRPSEAWRGNEIAKRSFLFKAAELVAEPLEDWYYVVDGDDFVSRVPFDLKERLQRSEHDAGEIRLWWRDDWQASSVMAEISREMDLPEVTWTPMRSFFRAIPGLRCEHAHMVYVYDGPEGKVFLRGREDVHALDPVEDLTDFHVEHRHNWRSVHRKQVSEDYYELRDHTRAEAIPDDYWAAA